MVFKVYIDIIFLINLMTNYVTLCSTAMITGVRKKNIRIWCAAALGGIYATLIFAFEQLNIIWAKLFVGALMIVVAFGYKKVIRLFLTYFGVSAVFAGIALAISYLLGNGMESEVSFLYLGISSSISYLILLAVFKPLSYGVEEKRILPLEITHNGKSVKINALLDTGNTLKDPLTNMRAVVVNLSALEELFANHEVDLIKRLSEEEAILSLPKIFRLIPYKTVERGGFMLAFRPDKISINEKERELLVAICKNEISDGGNYSALVGAVEG